MAIHRASKLNGYLLREARVRGQPCSSRQPMSSGRAEQILGLQCACCGQTYHPDTAMRDAFESAILGTDKYVECAVCGLSVPDDLRDDSYERRWRRAMKSHLQREEHGLLVALSVVTGMRSGAETDSLFDAILRKLQGHSPTKTLPELKESGDRLRRLLRGDYLDCQQGCSCACRHGHVFPRAKDTDHQSSEKACVQVPAAWLARSYLRPAIVPL
jgi:hypothetical protein